MFEMSILNAGIKRNCIGIKIRENVLNKFISTKIIYLDNRILEKEQNGKSEYEPKY